MRAMLGSVDRSHAQQIVAALARRDGPALLATVDALRQHGLSASGTLEEVATLLQQMAIEQAVPGALDDSDPDAIDAAQLAQEMPAPETQLLYSIALHGRAELPLMSDDYAALTMVLLRFLAFPSTHATAAANSSSKPMPLRAAAPPRMVLPVPKVVTNSPVPERPVVSSNDGLTHARIEASVIPAANTVLADRWYAMVKRLDKQGAILAMPRELALQSALIAVKQLDGVALWQLQVESDSLKGDAHRDKLAAALSTEMSTTVHIELLGGVPADTPAQRDAQARAARQAQAEDTIRSDEVVVELLQQFKGARIVPGSIKPISQAEGLTP